MTGLGLRATLSRHAPALMGLLLASVLIGYVHTGFLLDDSFLLARATQRFGLETLRFALRTTEHRIQLWVHPEPVVFEFFRPLVSLSLWLEWRVWGAQPWGYHLTNIACHLMNAVLAWRLALRCGLERGSALLAAVAWALSMQTIPAAGWISGRTELLWCTAMLIAVHQLLRWRDSRSEAAFAAAVLACAAAACSKETGLVTPLLALLTAHGAPALAPAPSPPVITRSRLAWLLLPAVLALTIRTLGIGLVLPPQPYVDIPHGALEIVWSVTKPFLYLAAGYLSVPLSHWGPLVWLHQHAWTVPLIVAVALALTALLTRAASPAARRLWLGWFALAILPVMPIRPTSLYLYAPMLGLCMLIAAAYQSSRNRVFAAWLLVMAVAGGGAHLFTQRYITAQWRTSEAQLSQVEQALRTQRAQRLITIDTPVWHYALPAAIALHTPGLEFETWFVNFKPRLDAIEGTTVRWRSELELELTAPAGGYLDSVFEQFLAFGGTPSPAPPAGSAPVTVVAEGPSGHPERLIVRFRDRATRDSALIVRFTRTGVERIGTGPVPALKGV